MKALHEAFDLVLEAKNRGTRRLSIEFNIDVESIRFFHIDDNFNIVKTLHSYYGGICQEIGTKDGVTVPFSEFNKELKRYLESCG